LLEENLDLLHLSFGAIIRKHINEETELGKRASAVFDAIGVIPDDLIIDLLKTEIAANEDQGWVIEGVPLTLDQVNKEALPV
jgi:adenylate kinase